MRQIMALALISSLFAGCAEFSAHSARPVIVCPENASSQVKMAAKELRRYIYLRTGELLPISSHPSIKSISLTQDAGLSTQEYRLKSAGDSLEISGGSEVAVLYGAYAFAEKLGVRFYLHGDVIPDTQTTLRIPQLDETRKPLFELRGIQPFHDFPEGPDWWTTDDYRAYIAQLPKMRMNFIGFHNYPGELLLWHGPVEDINPDGSVKSTYPSRWYSSTSHNAWGYAPMKTGDFTAGASQLFATDTMQSEIIGTDNKHFDRSAKMLGTIVSDAHKLGVKVAVGTETPLHIPGPVQARLKELGKTDATAAIYEGTFAWLMKNAPVDYYWAWTPESWIWGGNSMEAYKAVENDLKTAQSAARKLGNPFPVGTCGWVLGPQQNRAAWDQLLSKDAPIANINKNVAHAAIDPTFANIKDRPKWAIPWLENDPDMVAYQPWVKRLRYDAADAKRLGCTGLLGIHWRTKELAANVAALAQAGWDQPYPLTVVPEKDELTRGLPADDFYLDFARAQFGENLAQSAGKILTASDGFPAEFNPQKPGFWATTEWLVGPGSLRSNKEPWEQVRSAHYAFVEQFASLRPQVQGAGNLERFDFWLNTFRASELMAELACRRGELNLAVEKINAETETDAKKALAQSAIALRQELTRSWEKLISLQIQLVSTPGELGTIANLEQHSRANNHWLTFHDKTLAAALGAPLPADCAPSKEYVGPARLTVLTVRNTITKGEQLKLPVIALSASPCKSVFVHVRPLGAKEWQTISATNIARAVWQAQLPAATEDFEYYLTTDTNLTWPATAPQLNQTIIVTE